MKRYEVVAVIVGAVLTVTQLAELRSIIATKLEIKELAERVNTLESVVLYKTHVFNLSEQERECLARNVYYEAGNQSKAGQLAVAQVTLNRLKDGRWGHNVCSVVYSHAQFSWTLNKHKKWTQPKGELWHSAKETVVKVQQGYRIKGLEQSLTYHADYIEPPKWARKQEVVKYIGSHIFYKSVDETRI